MNPRHVQSAWPLSLAALVLACSSCSETTSSHTTQVAASPQLTTRGTVEVTAQLVEVPEGAIFKRDLYNYATILKYKVLQVHRGSVDGEFLFVGHYNPWKARGDAADQRVAGIGGNLRQFRAGQAHHMALEVPIDDHFMGGIVNKYFGQQTGPLYWAVWTDLSDE